MKITTLTLIGLFIGTLSLAQNNYQLPNIVPASPIAQTFMRYGEIPVDYSTGVPNIEIPIYILEGSQLKVPISISYHASGIKVNDIASEVGLGWALNCGALISRSVNGLPDERMLTHTYNSAAELLAAMNAAADQGYNQSSHCMDGIKNFEYFLTQRFLYEEDCMSDRYFYRLPDGTSGIFIYDYTDENNLITLPYKPFKIEKHIVSSSGNPNKIDWIKLTDADGTIYTFKSILQNAVNDYSEWYLTEMRAANGADIITFNYVLQPARSMSLTSQTYLGNAENVGINCSPANISSSLQTSFSPSTQFGTAVLASITSSTAIIQFYYETREDFSDLKRLREITIAPVNAPANIIKKIQFNESYFGTSNEDKRLKLDNIIISGGQDAYPQTYLFTYESQILPPYSFKMTYPSYQEDYWGYYNGNNSSYNKSLVPRDFIGNANDKQYYGGNREADLSSNQSYARACMLKEIKYPTGGRTVFDFGRYYNANVYSYKTDPNDRGGYIGGFRVNSITNYINNNTIANVKVYDYELPVTKYFDITLFSFDQWFIESSSNSSGIECWAKYSRKLVPSTPWLPLEVAPGMPIMYQKVTEYNGTAASHAGKTVFTYERPYSPSDYSSHPEHPSEFEHPKFYFTYHYDKGNYIPKMLSKTVYSFDGTNYHTVSKDEYKYSKLFTTAYNTGIKLTRPKQFPNIDYWCYACPIDAINCAQIANDLVIEYKASVVAIDTKAYQEASLLTNSKSYLYDAASEAKYVLTSTDYTYDEKNIAIKEKTTTSSNGDLLKFIYKYPLDYVITGTPNNDLARSIKNLQNLHIISPIIEQYIQRSVADGITNLRTAGGTFTFYNPNLPYPDKIYQFQASQPLTNFQPANITSNAATFDNHYQPRIYFDQYNAYGNILQRHKSDDVNEVYLWGYNAQYPVAKIVGSDYATVNSVVTQMQIDNAVNSGNDQTLRNLLNTLRTNSSTKDALITTYTYKPLIGITSMTDPKGYTSYYEYDDFGRLQDIKDANGNIIKTFEYNYKQ
ncbi:RHS repeat domain-containing protein [Parafilimonas sp.]|uniref:RHS repeat protein n=1 Tax=Parafilimonas sp. TaxID=1969739 RepID=UPI003F7F0E36